MCGDNLSIADKRLILAKQREKLAEELSNSKLKNIIQFNISNTYASWAPVISTQIYSIYTIKIFKTYVCNSKIDELLNYIIKNYKDVVYDVKTYTHVSEDYTLIELILKYE